ncbi:ABC transporter substrate-binding protein [Natronosporangium hydrolyticum]|uniref:ABC transporter substrate-binding protein n=1 Tax=Natronosporangium hydrolyticum TaxID=2811111 RepID=A0A895YIK7_9ACTN|nr:ABC transporter substrate-binding protein [Natronosporangium hydrolyticum]QSB14416.1 ABC transporter substrate-binding protein [Natronosporangium hydrolyticum]
MPHPSRALVRRHAHRVSAALLATVVLAAGAACGTEPDPDPGGAGEYPMTVTNCGRDVVIEQPPERILALGGEAAAMLWAAGGVDRISTFGPVDGEPLGAAADDLADLPTIDVPGSGEISRESIIGEQPDLVVTFGLNATSPEELADAGIPSLIISGRCDDAGAGQDAADYSALAAVYDDITTYGQLLGTEEQAQTAIEELQARVDAVAAQVEGDSARPGAALFVSGADSALGAYGGLSMVHEQLGILGFQNVFGDTAQRYFEPSVEALIDAQPEVIIALYQASDNSAETAEAALADRGELEDIPAVADDRVLAIDFFYTGNSIIAVDGLEQLAEQLRSLT